MFFKNQQVISDTLKAQLIENISRRLQTAAIRLRSKVDVTCFTPEGIEGIKAALRAGQACESDDVKLTISLIAPPCYAISTYGIF